MRAVIYLRSRRRSGPKRDLTAEGFPAAQCEACVRYDAGNGFELAGGHAVKGARGHERRNRDDLTLAA
jgi:hypothetical protein